MKYRLLGACAVAICCTAAPAFSQALPRVEVLALQQQLRDDGCGVSHVTGHMDAMTRAAVKKCESKYSGATDPKSMLAAMNIGFENGIPLPTLAAARMGGGGSMGAGGSSGLMKDSTAMPMTPPVSPTPPAVPPAPPVPTDTMIPPTNPPAIPVTPRDTSTMPRDTSSIPKRGKMPKPKRDTMPKHDTMPNTH